MTAEFKVILDGYLQWCRENNQDPCAASVTDSSGIQAGKRRYIFCELHPPDREQNTPRTATEADREHFNRLLCTSEHIAKATGIEQEIVFRALLESISNSPVIYPSDIIQNTDLIADDLVSDNCMRACADISGELSNDNQ